MWNSNGLLATVSPARSRRMSPAKLLASGLLFIGLALVPVYGASSGGLQASHVLLGLFCLGYFFRHGVAVRSIDLVMLALFFVALVREGVALLAGAPPSAMLHPAYIIFDVIVFNALSRLFERDGSSETVAKWGLYASVVVAVVGVAVLGYGLRIDEEGGRAVGTFNNPNQLGYFAICALSLTFLLRMRGKVSAVMLLFLVGACFFLSVVSLSKAAMLSAALAGLFAGYSLARNKSVVVVGAVLVLVVAGVGYLLYKAGTFNDFAFVRRLQGLGSQQDDSFQERGYFVFENAGGLEILFGFGSAAIRDLLGHEIHSTVFSFFGNYGFVGGMLFCLIIAAWMMKVKKGLGWSGLILVFTPPMAYGIPHNGSRFTIFWVLLSMSFGLLARRRDVTGARSR